MESSHVSSTDLQILETQSSVRCLCWSSRNSILGIGMSPAVALYRLSAQEVTAHRRARYRQANISSAAATPCPVWLQQPASNRHVGSYKLAKVRAQEELKHVSDPGLSQVCSFSDNKNSALAEHIVPSEPLSVFLSRPACFRTKI